MDFTISQVFLVVWYIMPGDIPDIRSHPQPMATVEDCVKEAMRFRARGIPESLVEKGVEALAFTCVEKQDKKT